MNKYVINYRLNLEPDDFKVLAEKSAASGATHVNIAQIEKSMWQWNIDRYDPYPNWSTFRASLFKIIVPEALREYLPLDYAKRNEERLYKNAETLKQFGLKASFTGFEPAFFPEQAYVDHPAWRGPRCDQTRRARHEYYSPCIDNPEILAMYREAMEKFCRVAPIEFFTFLTNDSGGGICWSENLYPGKNGPKSCKNISFGARIERFMSTLQEGAAAAGVTAEIAFSNGMFTDGEISDARAHMKKGQYINGLGAFGSALGTASVGNAMSSFDRTLYIPHPVNIAQDFAKLYGKNDSVVSIMVSNIHDDESFDVIKRSIENPAKGVLGITCNLIGAAEDFVGEKYAEELVTIWDELEKGMETLRVLDCGGHIFWIGAVHQRWLTRPLVPFPNELKPEERDYYRQYQFQATTEEDANDYLNIQGCSFIRGYAGVFMAERTIRRGMRRLVGAIKRIDSLAAEMKDNGYTARLCNLKNRIRLLLCLCENSINVCRFQDILDRADYENLPAKDVSPAWFEQGDPYYVKIKEIFRNEIDNTLEILSIMENADEPLFYTEKSIELEDVCFLGPDTAEQLRKKVAIMEAHRGDFDLLFKSLNK